MPDIGLMFDINKYPQKKDSVRGVLPSINILKGFYLSNPEGSKDFEVYQKTFENRFQCENIKVYILSYISYTYVSLVLMVP